MIMMPVTKAIIDPTDRSRHPDEMTKVAPTAIMAMKADRVTTFEMFVSVAKFEFTSMPTSNTIPSAMKGPMAAHRKRRGDSGIVIFVVTLVILVSFCVSGLSCFRVSRVRHAAGGGVDDV